MKTKNLTLIITLVLLGNLAQAQLNPGYFGRKNLISIEKAIPLKSLGKIRYERLIQNNVCLGFAAGRVTNHSDFASLNFGDDYLFTDVTVDYNGDNIPVEYAYGDIDIAHTSLEFNVKKYRRASAMAPIGPFWNFAFGMILSNYELKDGFRFANYDNQTNKMVYYGITEKTKRSFSSPFFSYELGSNAPFFGSKRLLFSYAVKLNVIINNRAEFLTASQYLAYRTVQRLSRSNVFNLNFGITYAL